MGAGGDEGADRAPAQDGDAEAFAAAYRLLAPQVRGYARRQVPDDLAEDVVAETFLVLWRRWADAPTAGDELRPWVFGVARNKIKHVLEQRSRQLRTVVGVAAAEPARAPVADPAERLAGDDLARWLLAQLPPAEGEAMSLTVWAGLTPSEAAEVLGCSLTALTSRLSRARARLAAALDGSVPDGAPPDGTTHDGTTHTSGPGGRDR
ncbi:RNA polymerase sigma factor [Cellulomonas sp. ACRRI]|uniref:RNA polymerase sigma factor n=1 Tax=Cellulomonas sp. ACRRI TaxID=2918188 RepID=UPI001EF1D18C|nr:RNA polymerase sigma factor [Cellulomonas sp. ACRRI]MCG7287892.1 RNA polymerase sigma factor [Cellulomonas sp. ACRRI]